MSEQEELTTPEARFGAYLKREREMRRVDLAYVAKFSRIPIERLEDLEAGRWDVFGAFVYLRGAIYNYARAVGLDADDLLLRLQSEVPIKTVAPPLITSDSPLFRKQRVTNRVTQLRTWGIAACAVAILAIATWLFMETYLVDVYQKRTETEKQLVAEQVSGTVLPVSVTNSVSGVPSHVTTNASSDERGVFASADTGDHQKKVSSEQASRTINIIEVYALDTAWLEYSSDGGEARSTILNPGDKLRIRAQRSVRIRSGNAGGVELYVNGIKQPALGEVGVVRERSFHF